jgi:hypothetical protein
MDIHSQEPSQDIGHKNNHCGWTHVGAGNTNSQSFSHSCTIATCVVYHCGKDRTISPRALRQSEYRVHGRKDASVLSMSL